MTQQTCDWCKAAVHEGTYLCNDCRATLARAIVNTGAHYADLETLRTKRRGVRYDIGGGKGGRKEQPVGMDLRFARVFRDAEERVTEGRGTEVEHLARNAAVTWARVVLDEWPHLTHPADNVPAVCALLASVVGAIVGQPWAKDILRDFRGTEAKLAALVDSRPPEWYAGKCSVPGEDDEDCKVDLYARAESGTIVCRGCGAQHDVGERRDVLLKEASDYLVTASEAAGALAAWSDYDGAENKLVDRIRKWQERGLLASHGTTRVNGQDRTLYRLGDIQTLEAKHAQRKRLGA